MNARLLLAALSGALSLWAVVSGTSAATLPATGPVVAGFEACDELIPTLLEEGHLPGAAVAVAYRGRIVFARGYGYADRESSRPVQPDTRFRIGSISKTFTAALVLRLVEEGRLSLDTLVFPALGYPTPTYAGARRDPRIDRVTVRQLLNHTGGWDTYSAPNPWLPEQLVFDPTSWEWHVARSMQSSAPASAETIVRFMIGQQLQAVPGAIWSYTNFGYLALGRLIEQKTGLGYEDAVRQFVANAYISGLAIGNSRRNELAADEAVYYDYPGAPLRHLYNQYLSSYRVSPGDGELVPAPYAWAPRSSDACGGWTASAIEVLRFLVALDGLNGTPPLLKPESIVAMRTGIPPATWYGLGWFTTNANNTNPPGSDSGHGGNHFGSTSYALRSADGEWHMVALLNGSVDLASNNALNRMNTEATRVLHLRPDYAAAPPDHDFTWSTLGWEAWLRYHALTAVAETDDPDHDGVPNLVEYASGLDPMNADAQAPLAIGGLSDGTVVVTYRRAILEHAITCVVETSADGITWQPVTAMPRRTALNADGTLSITVVAADATCARLRVTRPASSGTVSFAVDRRPAARTRLVNLSTRGHAGPGDDTMIAGFVVEGTSPRTFLFRGVGPGLAQFGVPETLTNPRLALFDAEGREITVNHDWCANRTALRSAFEEAFAFSLGERSTDAAMLVTLRPGIYTAHLSSAGGSGHALAEIYELDSGDSRAVNLSTRARVGGDAGEMIAGFVIAGDASRRVLLRAVGPGLAAWLDHPLTDPSLKVVRMSDRAEIASNTGWSNGSADATAGIIAGMAEAGAFPLADGSADSAVMLTLPPGAYTMIVDSAAHHTGVALAEVYELP